MELPAPTPHTCCCSCSTWCWAVGWVGSAWGKVQNSHRTRYSRKTWPDVSGTIYFLSIFFFSPLNWPGTRYEVTQRRFLNENPFTFNGKWCTPVPSVPMLTSGIRQGLFTGGRRRELKACSMPGPTASPVADGHGFGLRNPCLLGVLGLTSLRQVGGEGCGLQIHWDRKMLLPRLSPRVMSLEAAEWHYL